MLPLHGSDNGTPVVAHLFDGLDDNYLNEQYGGLIASTAELDLATQFSNDGSESPEDIVWYTLVLEDPTPPLVVRFAAVSSTTVVKRSDLGVAVRLRQHMLCLRTIWQR